MERISEEYLYQLSLIHNDPTKDFGKREKHCQYGKDFIEKYKPASVLDYGCGSGATTQMLAKLYPGISFIGYDPAVPQFANEPEAAEMVYCFDVLEHIEPEHLDKVLDHINGLFTKCAYFKIDLGPAQKFLEDGRNAHLIQESAKWWESKISRMSGNIIWQTDFQNLHYYLLIQK
jgi:SAM-dependent methyltransferase